MQVEPAVQSGVRDEVLQLLFPGERSASRATLPGPLATTLNRRFLRNVQAEEYLVCEKSDGERRMLYAVCDGSR